MSMLIRGMDIPAHCGKCPIETNECRLWENFGDRWERRHPDCPLVEVKTPHGRLIDADKFAETLKEVSIRQGYDKLFSDNILSVGDVFDAIAADLKGEGLDKYKPAPTVIEAEGSET